MSSVLLFNKDGFLALIKKSFSVRHKWHRYRDDGLVLLRNASGPQSERTRKDITQEFKKQGLSISISTNLKICNFLDVTLNLTDGTYYPYRKPNNETLYIDSNSNHPPTIVKHLPAAIGRRISDISSSKELFNKAKPHYESASRPPMRH